jgi:cytochrome c-type biogenesis protein CcmE
MKKPKRQRLFFVVAGVSLMAGAVALALVALGDSIVFFHSPSDVVEKKIQVGKKFRLGGLVEAGSVGKLKDGVTITFKVTDCVRSIQVHRRGVLPDLFREGQGVVAEGALRADGVFVASQVLAKHDEKYMPPEVAEGLKKGHKAGMKRCRQ